jgi:ABC-type dipeptide/oligopeptide/nickel transport system permease component
MSVRRHIAIRLLTVIPLSFGVVTLTFFIVHLIPGSPVYLIVGGNASQETVDAAIHRLGLDQPLFVQYLTYLQGLAHGDLGTSLFTGQPVLDDIADRLPATFELITLSLILGIILSLIVGAISALNPGGIIDRLSQVYSFLGGSTPDFWLALILIFVFYTVLSIAPPPIGRVGLEQPPTRVTGMYLLDSVLTLDGKSFATVAGHYALPVATLVIVYSAGILKMIRQTMLDVLQGDAVRFARACGLSRQQIGLIALRNAAPPILTISGITYGFLLGGAVLVETVFSWGGLGQYAVQSIAQKDFVAIQGFVLVASIFSILVYLVLDLLYAVVDPRLRLSTR